MMNDRRRRRIYQLYRRYIKLLEEDDTSETDAAIIESFIRLISSTRPATLGHVVLLDDVEFAINKAKN